MPSRDTNALLDSAVALLLFAGVVAYLISLPRALGGADESYFLYESKRIAEGEVMYRDIFQFVTPGAPYIMALLFLTFGTTMTTARTTMAVLHGLTALLSFATCRRLHVRREAAAVVPFAYLAVCQAAWPYASWHWFSTSTLVLQCWFLSRRPWPRRPGWAAIAGVLSGVSIGVQQQRGLPVACAVGVLLVIDHLIGRRYGEREPWPMLMARLTAYGLGVLSVLVLLLAPSLWLAGPDALVEAWVRFPLQSYRRAFGSPWGNVGPLARAFAPNTFPALLRWAPALLLVQALRLGAYLGLGIAPERARQQAMLLLLCGASIVSIWYNPDFIHIAFIAPVFLIAGVETMNTVWSAISQWRRVAIGLAWTLSVAIAAACGGHLLSNFTRAWSTFPVAHDTAFGRVDFATKWEPAMIDATRALLRDSPSKELFCYPTLAGPYLTTGGKNPTPFQYFDRNVLPREYTDEVLATLHARQVPFVVLSYAYVRPDDPVVLLLKEAYEPAPMPSVLKSGELPTLLVYRRVRPGVAPAAREDPPRQVF